VAIAAQQLRRLDKPRDWFNSWQLTDLADDTPAALCWRDAHAGARDIFRTTLGPSYNLLHRDHFHHDMESFSVCR
jgi:hypothetical protein